MRGWVKWREAATPVSAAFPRRRDDAVRAATWPPELWGRGTTEGGQKDLPRKLSGFGAGNNLVLRGLSAVVPCIYNVYTGGKDENNREKVGQ